MTSGRSHGKHYTFLIIIRRNNNNNNSKKKKKEPGSIIARKRISRHRQQHMHLGPCCL